MVNDKKVTGDPYAEGYDARFLGKSDCDNPYDVQTDEHLSWNDGYNACADEDENEAVEEMEEDDDEEDEEGS